MVGKNYYTQRLNAQRDINRMAQSGKIDTDSISFEIQNRYGFPERFVLMWLSTLESRGFIKKEKDGTWSSTSKK